MNHLFLRLTGTLLAAVWILWGTSCQTETTKENVPVVETSGFSLVEASHSGIDFNNSITEDLYFNFIFYPYILTGGGVAVADINNDGLTDIYFGANQGSNKLYLNKGNLQFEDISKSAGVEDEAGWTTGIAFIDINADGFMDIYVCKSASPADNAARRNKLYINNGNSTFTESAARYGLDDAAFSIQSYFFDYDKDGDLDMYLVNHRIDFNNNSKISTEIQRDVSPYTSDKLYRNDGDGFTDVTQAAGITNKAWGLSASIADFNEDGWPDLYVCNDYLEPDRLLINQKNGTFIDEVLTKMDHISFYSMGSDIADINNDNRQDLIVLDMVPDDHVRSKRNMSSMSTDMFMSMVNVGYHYQYMSNMLHLNNGGGNFSEIGNMAGISKTDWSWAPLIADFDNDGWNDLYVTNGIKFDVTDNDYRIALAERSKTGKPLTLDELFSLVPSTKTNNHIFHNTGKLAFKDLTQEWNMDQKGYSNGAAYADLDNDGDLELIVNNVDETAYIYQNLSNANSLTINLIGPPGNPAAIGSRVTLTTSDGTQIREQYLSRGFQSSVDPRIHFGLGKNTIIEQVQVEWPDGSFSQFEDLKANTTLAASYKSGGKAPVQKKGKKYFTKLQPSQYGLNYTHTESEFNDFAREILLPQKQSTLGPKISRGDVNGDSRDDLFIGGAKDVSAVLFIQSESGGFEKVTVEAFNADRRFEDLASCFFDADGDGDQDLYVTSGSNEYEAGSVNYTDRLYIGDGKGGFSKAENALPDLRSNSICVVAGDYDADGDTDLFIGAKGLPGKYPYPDKSYLLENNDGKFSEASGNAVQDLGMVTDAVFSDYDDDGDLDLLVVGEWMPVTILKNENGHFNDDVITLPASLGWWYSIHAEDMDDDGDEDYVLGNLGLNNKFGAKPDKPFHVYASDFDKTGSMDIVLSKEGRDGLLPVRGRECSSQQMPFIQEKFPTYKNFAEAGLEDIYGEENLSNALHLKTETFASCFLENNGGGNMELRKLPAQAQLGPLLSCLTTDLNGDGKKDIIGVGNIYNTEVETIRYDASKGFVLSAGHENLDNCGLVTEGNVKDMELIEVGGETLLVIAANNAPLQLYRLEKY